MQYYLLEKRNQANLVLNALAKTFKIEKNTVNKENRRYYDSVDWRLLRQNLCLYHAEKQLHLGNLNYNLTIANFPFENLPQTLFVKELPASSLKNRLKPIIDVRALIHQLSEKCTAQEIYLLNTDDKRVVRLCFRRSILLRDQKESPLNQTLQVNPIRGYEKESEMAQEIIRDFGIESLSDSLFRRLIGTAGIKPERHSSKIKFDFQDTIPIGEALQKIFIQFAEVMKRNEAGIRKDIDIEFLHDFRVAVRRTRSLMSQAKSIIPAREGAYFKIKFADLQKKTNNLRDLDVFLLKEQPFKKILPVSLKKSLDSLFDDIRQQRRNAQQNVAELLVSKEYREMMKEWSHFLRAGQLLSHPEAKTPVVRFAKKVIRKRLKRVLLEMNNLIIGSPQDGQIHALRIEAKKLRYLLEFFSSIFPVQEMNEIVDHLKGVQDLLGSYNDLVIQSRDLEKRLSELNFSNKTASRTAAAFGGLLTHFTQEKVAIKKQLKKTFQLINDPTQIKKYQSLFNYRIK